MTDTLTLQQVQEHKMYPILMFAMDTYYNLGSHHRTSYEPDLIISSWVKAFTSAINTYDDVRDYFDNLFSVNQDFIHAGLVLPEGSGFNSSWSIQFSKQYVNMYSSYSVMEEGYYMDNVDFVIRISIVDLLKNLKHSFDRRGHGVDFKFNWVNGSGAIARKYGACEHFDDYIFDCLEWSK